MSSGTIDLSSSAVTIQSSIASNVNADETLIEFYQKLDQDYDLKIDLVANWNDFFANVVLPGPMADDSDPSGSNDISGASYVDFGDNSSDMPGDLLDAAKGASTASSSGDGAFWAGCTDDNLSNDNNGDGTRNTHVQSVARGLVGLFSHSSTAKAAGENNVIVLEDASGANASSDVADADANYEIRISEGQVRQWMSDSSGNLGADPASSYGKNVFTDAQIQELLTACSDMGRYHIEDVTGGAVAGDNKTLPGSRPRTDILDGHRVLALRSGDMLQVRVTVYDTTGTIAQADTPNKRVWLVSLKQSGTGAYTSASGYAPAS
jgi:hypothetical protein